MIVSGAVPGAGSSERKIKGTSGVLCSAPQGYTSADERAKDRKKSQMQAVSRG
jgi:hypothetical protein